MKSVTRMICRFLIVAIAMLPFHAAQAGMIGTDQVVSNAQAERAVIQSMLGRTEVASQLQALGVDPNTARARVAAMTDQEILALSGNLDSLPAGARSSGWGWALVIGLVIWFMYRAR